jgi:16S rRNA (adenine1518-N6/adenine1519-N6)-dimethyltransferase
MIHKPKKSLGQNFLKSERIINKMCEVAEINKDDVILEVGPGKGILTKKFLEKAKLVIAVEKDRELVSFLQEKFFEEIKQKKLVLLNDDILEIDPLLISPLAGGERKVEYKIVANIPYNITGAILKKFLSDKIQPTSMTLLVQKEVAERIVGRNPSTSSTKLTTSPLRTRESILSLSIKAYGTPKYIEKVDRRYFSPSPRVDSAIISISNISKKNFKNTKEEKMFFEILRAGFAHKRKILLNNLEILDKKRGRIDKIFEILKIDKKTRAENVQLPEWLKISYFWTQKD